MVMYRFDQTTSLFPLSDGWVLSINDNIRIYKLSPSFILTLPLSKIALEKQVEFIYLSSR